MDYTKKLICMLAFVLFAFNVNNISAEEVEEDDYSIVYVDMSNEEEVISAAKDAFDKGAKIVEVNDKEESIINPFARESGWETNTRQFFYGDIYNASKGTITCYVRFGTANGTHVNKCTLDVTIYGNDVTFVSKYIENDYTTSVTGKWQVKIGGSWVGLPANQYHSVPLFD